MPEELNAQLPARLIFPAPEKTSCAFDAAELDKLPPMISVPVPIVMLPIRAPLLASMETLLATVNVWAAISNFAVELVEASPTVNVEHAAAAVNVTVKPGEIVTISPATGNEAPEAPPNVADQVAVLFQLLLATAKRLAALAAPAVNKKIINKIFKEFLMI